MCLKWLIIRIILHTLFKSMGVNVDGVTLSPRVVDEWEKTNITLHCTNHAHHFKAVRWNRNGEENAVERIENTCKVFGFLAHKTLYIHSCTYNTTFSLTLKNISHEHNGDKWKCLTVDMIESNTVTIFVKAQARTAAIFPNEKVLSIAEKETIHSLRCESNQCRPEPTFRWYTDKSTESRDDDRLLWEYNPGLTISEKIRSYGNTFGSTLNRTLNGWYIFCSANNSMDDFVFSDKLLLNITYPPDNPPRIDELENESEYSVIEGNFVNLTCSVTGGYPLPVLQWNRNTVVAQELNGSTVTQTISWQASRKEVLTCSSIHLNKHETTIVNVTVLFPPNEPELLIKTQTGEFVHVMDTIYVIEQTPFTINCSADSNPPVSVFEWSGLSQSNGSLVEISQETRTQSTVTCTVLNKMKDSASDVIVTGKNSTSLKVNVLYPPTVKILLEKTRLSEGDDFNYTCNVTQGNPDVTNVTWSWENQTWYGHQLRLENVLRNLAGVYECCASNIMVSSQFPTVIGKDCVRNHLNVEFQAKVLYLIVNAHNTTENLTVNEKDTLNIACEIEGNPLPKGNLKFKAASDIQNKLVDINTTTHSIPTFSNLHLLTTLCTKCTDAGQYTCTGLNTLYNGLKTISTKSLMLHVKCKPRKSPNHEIIDRVFSDVTRDVTLSFTALAYPVPPESGYVWSKKTVNGEWTILNVTSNDDKIIIATNGLKSELTIKNITELDFGLYKLVVENDVGKYEHTFSLTAEDKRESFQFGLAAIGAIGSVSLLVVMVVAIAVYKRRYKGVKKKRISAYNKAKEEHIYHNVNTEMTEQDDQASKVQNKIEINKKSLLAKLSPLTRKPAAIEATNASEECDHYTNIIELEQFDKNKDVDHHGDIQVLVHNCDVKELDHHGDFQAIHQHGDSQDRDDSCDFQHLHHFDELQELELYDDPEELDVEEPNRAEYGNTLEMVKLIERVHVTELFSYLTGITKDYFETQFAKLPKGLTKIYSFSQKPENIPLNRYHGIYPYDHSRVKIPDIPDFFINACYIDEIKDTLQT